MNKTNEWKLAAKWLCMCGCLPEYLKGQLDKDSLTISKFGMELRNGVILCNLLNYLKPNSIDLSKVSKHSKTSRVMSAYNIGLFQEALNFFELNENFVIDSDKLFDLDLSQVLKVLSQLSICSYSIKKGFTGFYIDNDYSLQTGPLNNEQTSENNNESFYVYAPTTFFIDNKQEIQVYDKINEHYKSHESKASTLFNTKAAVKRTDHILREILLTEESYLNMLNSLQNDYLLPVSKVLNYENYKCISINIEILLKFHNLLYYKLMEACEGGPGRTTRICNVFLSFKKQFVEKYSFYFENIDDALEKISALSSNDNSFKKLLEECQLGNSFSLTDLLVQPFQRMTKYHLFFKEIYAKSTVAADVKELFEKTWEAMEEICKYLNQCKKDQDNITKINFLIKTLSSFKLKRELNLKVFGRFLKDENLRKLRSTHLQEKDNGKKIVFLFEKAIIIISKSFNSYNYIDTIPLDDYLLNDSSAVSNILFAKQSLDSTTSSKASVNESSCCLSLHNPNNNKNYMFCFKSQEQKNEWIKLYNIATPPDSTNNHKFTLQNFERNIVECCVCNKYLNGVFFQGYKCDYCLCIAHRECLVKIKPCEVTLTLNDNLLSCQVESNEDKRKKNSPNENTIQRSKLIDIIPTTENSTLHNIYKVINNYDGDSQPKKTPMLNLKKGDLVYIEANNSEAELAYGFKLRFKSRQTMSIYKRDIFREEGYFPMAVVNKAKINTELEIYSWYLECDKNLALVILDRIQNFSMSKVTFFMVRFRKEAGYAISISLNNKIRNIKINPIIKNDMIYYSIDNHRYFKSITELINFFIKNSLVTYFPDIDTTLGKPYREVLPEPSYWIISPNDYSPDGDYLESKNQEILVKKGSEYFVLQEYEHWVYVFNSDGLLGYVPKHLLDQK